MEELQLQLNQFAAALGITREQLDIVMRPPVQDPVLPPSDPLVPPPIHYQTEASLQEAINIMCALVAMETQGTKVPVPVFNALLRPYMRQGGVPHPENLKPSHVTATFPDGFPRKATQADFAAPVVRPIKKAKRSEPREPKKEEPEEFKFAVPQLPAVKRDTWKRSTAGGSSSGQSSSGQMGEVSSTTRSPPVKLAYNGDGLQWSILMEGFTGGIRETIMAEEGLKVFERFEHLIDFKTFDPLAKVDIDGLDEIGGKMLPHNDSSTWHYTIYALNKAGIPILRGGDGTDPSAITGARSAPLSPEEREFNTLRKIAYWYTFLLPPSKLDAQMIISLGFPPKREKEQNSNFASTVRSYKGAYARLGAEVAKVLKGHPQEMKYRELKLVPSFNIA